MSALRPIYIVSTLAWLSACGAEEVSTTEAASISQDSLGTYSRMEEDGTQRSISLMTDGAFRWSVSPPEESARASRGQYVASRRYGRDNLRFAHEIGAVSNWRYRFHEDGSLELRSAGSSEWTPFERQTTPSCDYRADCVAQGMELSCDEGRFTCRANRCVEIGCSDERTNAEIIVALQQDGIFRRPAILDEWSIEDDDAWSVQIREIEIENDLADVAGNFFAELLSDWGVENDMSLLGSEAIVNVQAGLHNTEILEYLASHVLSDDGATALLPVLLAGDYAELARLYVEDTGAELVGVDAFVIDPDNDEDTAIAVAIWFSEAY